MNAGSAPALINVNLRASKSFKLFAGATKEMAAQDNSGAKQGDQMASLVHSIHSGSAGAHASQHYVTFSVNAENLLNHVNRDVPIGVVNSPLFGRANSLAPSPFSNPSSNRRINLQMTFVF